MSSNALDTTASDAELDSAIAHLRSLNRRAFLEYVLQVGQFLVDRFFGGEFAAVHSFAANKAHSFAALLTRRRAELAELNLSGATLRNYIAATEAYASLPQQTRAKLGLDHLRRLAAIKDVAERKRLGHDAATMQWTREQTTTAVRDAKRAQRIGKKKPGPKSRPAVVRAARAMHASIKALFKLQGAASRLEDGHRAEFDATVAEAMALLRSMVMG